MELKNFFVQDDQGNKLPGALCYLYLRGTESPAPGAVKANGVPLEMPFMASNDGLVQVAAPNGLYDLRATGGGRDYRLRLQFNDVSESLESAQVAAERAEVARDAAQLSAGVYDDIATGLRPENTVPGQYFSVPSDISGEFLILYKNVAGTAVEINRYSSAELKETVDDIGLRVEDVEVDNSADSILAVGDSNGRAALKVGTNGLVDAPNLRVRTIESDEQDLAALFAFALADEHGNAAFSVDNQGRHILGAGESQATSAWQELNIGSDDSIVHIGDSYTASHYALKDKAYISQLSALSPYRHQNFGVSGNDLLDMQYRIINGVDSTGMKFGQMQAKFAFLCSLTNDGAFRSVDQTYYAQNVGRLIDTVRAYGTEPVICTQFPATSIEHAFLARVAEEYGCAFIDCTTYAAEVGGLQLGPFHQGHPGTRTGGVFWLPMLEFIDRMPKPERAIKIYRRRSTHAVTGVADLLYKDRIDRHKKWKELTVFHYSITPESKFEELSQLGTGWSYSSRADEYQRIAAGSPVQFSDYGLFEITLPGTAATLEGVEVELVVSGTPSVFVRNYLDIAASMPGKIQGATPTDATYLAKWDKPRGAWRALGPYMSKISIPAAELAQSMSGNTLALMLSGAYTVYGLKVRFKGRERRAELRSKQRTAIAGENLIAQPLSGNATQLADWTKTGAPATIVPIDLYNAPRKPGLSTAVDGVCTVSTTDMIAQAVALPAESGIPRRYRLEVWARYFPKAFLDPSLYPGIDQSQVVNRIAQPSGALITTDTNDLRTLKCEMWNGDSYPTAGGAEFVDFAALQWRPIAFEFDAVPYRTASKLNFRLSCTDGEIQIAKTQLWEITKWA